MKKIFKKFKGIFCFTICLCIAVATFQVGVFAEESGVIVNSKLLQNNDGTVYGNGILSGLINYVITKRQEKIGAMIILKQMISYVLLILLHIRSIRLFKI